MYFPLCLFQHKGLLLLGTKPKPYKFCSYVSAWNVQPKTFEKPSNVPSISQTSTLPRPVITQAIKKLTDGNNFIIIWKTTGKPTYCLVKKHYIFITADSNEWERSYSLVFRSSLAQHNQAVARNLIKHKKYRISIVLYFPPQMGEKKNDRDSLKKCSEQRGLSEVRR